ncbi:MAG: UV DNA damage repair endonuclease UvsE [Candidatus Woesearchaeota archaeon]|jgi:UV DNA damage endonuclease
MKIGYPCINWSIGCTANTTFRLANYTDQLLLEKSINNIGCLKKILKYNLDHDIFLFRIGSDFIPFASHEICNVEWDLMLKEAFIDIGNFIKEHNMRISMHPDQFVLLNSEKKDVLENSIKELVYHAKLLDVMDLDETAKIQIHVGGVYDDKEKSIERFVKNYKKLPERVKARLIIENDDKSYSLKDCLEIHKKTKVPIIFDAFHHECLNNEEPLAEAVKLASKTWKKKDGILIMDYSSQKMGERKGAHATNIDEQLFKKFLEETKGLDFDLMLEIKDKEKSALKAISIAKSMKRL